jgi:PPE-repeat protein
MDPITAPPEVTSALIYSGPGAGALIEASNAWQQLGTELEHAATSYTSVLSSLTAAWRGPSSMAMSQAVEPYLTWMRTTAQQCLQAGSSAQAAAAAFTSVRSAIVPPAVVSANRTRLAQLIATNQFGINLPAIAETEAQYQSMWVNNSAAMSRYAAASAQATALPQFSSPPPVANPAGLAAQASAVPADPPATSAVSSTLSSLATAADSLFNNGLFSQGSTWGNQFISSGFPINLLSMFSTFWTAQAVSNVGGDIAQGLSEGQAALGPLGGLGLGEASVAKLLSAVSPAGQAAAPTASLGAGVSVGKLTMPPAVVGLLPASQPQVHLASAVSPLPSGGSGSPSFPMMPIMPPPISPGSGWRKRKQQKYEDLEYGLEVKGRVIHRPPSAG